MSFPSVRIMAAFAGTTIIAVIIAGLYANVVIGFGILAAVLLVAARMSQAQEHFQRWEDHHQLRQRLESGASVEPRARMPRLPWER